MILPLLAYRFDSTIELKSKPFLVSPLAGRLKLLRPPLLRRIKMVVKKVNR